MKAGKMPIELTLVALQASIKLLGVGNGGGAGSTGA